MSETATKGETGREEEEEGTDEVPTAQLSLAQVDICPPPSSFPLHPCSWCNEGGMDGRTEVVKGCLGWGWGGVGGVNQGRQDRW